MTLRAQRVSTDRRDSHTWAQETVLTHTHTVTNTHTHTQTPNSHMDTRIQRLNALSQPPLNRSIDLSHRLMFLRELMSIISAEK